MKATRKHGTLYDVARGAQDVVGNLQKHRNPARDLVHDSTACVQLAEPIHMVGLRHRYACLMCQLPDEDSD